jgi:hypothetical protein
MDKNRIHDPEHSICVLPFTGLLHCKNADFLDTNYPINKIYDLLSEGASKLNSLHGAEHKSTHKQPGIFRPLKIYQYFHNKSTSALALVEILSFVECALANEKLGSLPDEQST